MRKLDLIDNLIDLELQKPGLIDWSGIRSSLQELGIDLDRRVLISRVKAALKRRNN